MPAMVLQGCSDSGVAAVMPPRITPSLAQADLRSLKLTRCADMVLESMVSLHCIVELAYCQAGEYMRRHDSYNPPIKPNNPLKPDTMSQ